MAEENILLVEDHKDSLDACVSLLSAQGYNVTGSESGKDALALCSKKKFELVISDYQLDDMTGLNVLTSAKKMIPDCLTIIITAYATNDLITKAFRDGIVTAFLMKPLDTDKLLSTIKSCMLRRSLKGSISRLTDSRDDPAPASEE